MYFFLPSMISSMYHIWFSVKHFNVYFGFCWLSKCLGNFVCNSVFTVLFFRNEKGGLEEYTFFMSENLIPWILKWSNKNAHKFTIFNSLECFSRKCWQKSHICQIFNLLLANFANIYNIDMYIHYVHIIQCIIPSIDVC